MSRYLGPKVRLSRSLGVAIADLPKHNKTEFTAPGMKHPWGIAIDADDNVFATDFGSEVLFEFTSVRLKHE